jgi:hypothetical protein
MPKFEPSAPVRACRQRPAVQLRKLETIAAMPIKHYGLLFLRKPIRRVQ